MFARLKILIKERPLPFAVFTGALLVTLWFAFGFVAKVIYWNDPAHKNQALEPWMTPRYVMHSYSLKPNVTAEILGIDHPFPHKVRIEDIIQKTGMSLDQLTQKLKQAAEK